MKRYNFYEFLLRFVSIIAETTAVYLIYLVCQRWLHLPVITLPYLVIAGGVGMLVSGLSIPRLSERAMSNIIIFSGAAVSLAVSISVSNGCRVEGILFLAVFLFFMWSRGIRSGNCEYLEIYKIQTFYFYIAYFIFINYIVFVAGLMENASAEVARYTILYIILALFMLFQMKSEKYLKKTKTEKKLSFDLVSIIGIIGATLLLSTPKATAILAIPFKLVYELLIKLLTIIVTPIAYFLSFIVSKFGINNSRKLEQMAESMKKNGFKPKIKFEDQYYNPQLIDTTVRVITIAILIIATIIIVNVIIKYMQKLNRRRINDEFTEDREFVTGMSMAKLSQYVKNAGNKLSSAVSMAVFRLSADNREKLRYEYGMFVHKLYSKKIIEMKNHTAQDIMGLLRESYPQATESLNQMTEMYETVRYGIAEPKNEELKEFKKNIGNILKAL